MDWSTILSTTPNELSVEQLEVISNELPSVDANSLGVDELRKFFELNRFLIELLSKDAHQSKILQTHSSVDKKSPKGNDTDESYYIQTIQELNREIAQHVFNKKASNEDGTIQTANSGDTDSLQPLAIETKRDLLYKIHVKNKYIKRLLSENEALKADVDRQKEEILLLNVSLKQTTHKLAQAMGELSDQKNRNHLTADDMADLHAKINSVREQIARIESDKQKYKHDVQYLGDEMQKKINQWNELLKRKYSSYQPSEKTTVDIDADGIRNLDSDIIEHRRASDVDGKFLRYDENRFEVNVLSQAINKRNAIITEMESLLIDLTMEISQSAVVINRIIANLSKRESHFAYNLEKLRNHLAKLLVRPSMAMEPKHGQEQEQDTVSSPANSEVKHLEKLVLKRKNGKKRTTDN